jgi:hypothetical protein
MSMKFSTKLSAVSSALILAGMFMFGGSAQADTVTTNFANVTPGQNVTVNSTTPAFNSGTSAGVFNHTITASSPSGIDLSPAGTNQFVAFCADLSDTAGDNVVYNIVGLENIPDPVGSNMGSAKAWDISRMLYNALGANLAAASGLPDVNAAGLQIAVWEVVFETSGTYNTGLGNITFSNNASAIAAANTYLGGISGTMGMAGLVGLTNTSRQDFIAQVVPIPAAAWLFGSALVGIAGVGRRKLSKDRELQA